MKLLISLIAIVTLLGCSNFTKRKPSSVLTDKDHTALGVVLNNGIGKRRATRVYIKPNSNDPETFWVLVLEYKKLRRVGSKFLTSSKFPHWASKYLFGYLNKINQRAILYKASPTDTQNTFDLKVVQIKDEKISTRKANRYSQLILKDLNQSNVLEGGRITASLDGEPTNIYIPYSNEAKVAKKYGSQYWLAKLAYNKAKLKSTWRDDFLQGPYLNEYNNLEYEVLKLKQFDSNNGQALFTNKKLPSKEFTNPKSADIEGAFTSKKLANGIFVFNTSEESSSGQEHITNKPVLFVDIFDARESRNQDVVELIATNPDDATDFLMYFEHPDNGEGERR